MQGFTGTLKGFIMTLKGFITPTESVCVSSNPHSLSKRLCCSSGGECAVEHPIAKEWVLEKVEVYSNKVQQTLFA